MDEKILCITWVTRNLMDLRDKGLRDYEVDGSCSYPVKVAGDK